jgi:hypothetical protein
VAQHVFVKINIELSLWVKAAQIFGRLLYFSDKLLKENNRPMGENSPNLVTLPASNLVNKNQSFI